VILLKRRQWILIILLILISPLFGVVLADMVGYHEPLDIAAEKLGLKDISDEINWSPFYDYSVPGLDPITGYIVSGFIGVGIIYLIGSLIQRIAGKKQ